MMHQQSRWAISTVVFVIVFCRGQAATSSSSATKPRSLAGLKKLAAPDSSVSAGQESTFCGSGYGGSRSWLRFAGPVTAGSTESVARRAVPTLIGAISD